MLVEGVIVKIGCIQLRVRCEVKRLKLVVAQIKHIELCQLRDVKLGDVASLEVSKVELLRVTVYLHLSGARYVECHGCARPYSRAI